MDNEELDYQTFDDGTDYSMLETGADEEMPPPKQSAVKEESGGMLGALGKVADAAGGGDGKKKKKIEITVQNLPQVWKEIRHTAIGKKFNATVRALLTKAFGSSIILAIVRPIKVGLGQDYVGALLDVTQSPVITFSPTIRVLDEILKNGQLPPFGSVQDALNMALDTVKKTDTKPSAPSPTKAA